MNVTEFFGPIQELAVLVVACVAAAASVVGAIYWSWGHWIEPAFEAVRTTVRKLEAASDLIDAQLRPNGGGSLLDRIERIDEKLTHGCPLFGDSGICPAGAAPGPGESKGGRRMSVGSDGWLDWTDHDYPGPPNKVYPHANTGLGIVCHSMEGWWAGSVRELLKPERQASWMFSNCQDGRMFQHYPVTASCWASGNRLANTTLWSVESEGMAGTPLNAAQVANMLRLTRDWEAHTGRKATRELAGKSLHEHCEVALWEMPNAGPTACPSHRYDGFFTALGQEDEMTPAERELLLLCATVLAGRNSGADYATAEDALPNLRMLAGNDILAMQGLWNTQKELNDVKARLDSYLAGQQA